MYGIESRTEGNPNPSDIRNIRRIALQYSDGGQVNFEPEPGLDTLNEDDLIELSKIFAKAAVTIEWAEHTGKG
jgi:hypothetical protein